MADYISKQLSGRKFHSERTELLNLPTNHTTVMAKGVCQLKYRPLILLNRQWTKTFLSFLCQSRSHRIKNRWRRASVRSFNCKLNMPREVEIKAVETVSVHYCARARISAI